MKQFVCAVWDSAMQAFARPLFVPALGVALRSFQDEVARRAPDNQLSNHPEDFELHVLAEFHEQEGVFTEPEGGKRCLMRGKDVVVKEA